MAKAKAKAAAIAVPVPQTRDEAREFIARLGVHQRMRETLQTDMNADLANITAHYGALAAEQANAIAALTEGICIWAAAHRDELTDGGKTKTAVLSTGELRWRMTPPSVTLRNVADIIKALAKARLRRFIRLKFEVNKEAILAEPEAVKEIAGITIGQHEEFVVVPNETKLEEVA